MSADDLCFLSALDLRARYRRRDLSPVEVTDAILNRIERVNPRLTAFVTVSAERARDDARVAERAYAPGGSPGPLAGIPISIKDLAPTKGIRTARGSLVDPDWVPDFDAPFVERVAAAGAVLLGKTNTPELGWKGDSGNLVFGPTHNPWQHGRTAGGSSGGAGAAVAAGLGPLAQGSDGAGSIRIPSGFCGIFGHKPSFGLVPQFPASSVGDISHVGPMTRTVRDAALLLDVVAGADPRDRFTWSSGIDYLAATEGAITGLRVAWSPDLGYVSVDPDVRAVATSAARRFEELGCTVEEVNPGLPDPWEIMDLIWTSSMAAIFHANLDAVRAILDPELITQVIEPGLRVRAVDLAAAHQRRNAYYQQWRTFMESYDLLLTPTLPITAFTAGAVKPDGPSSYLSWTSFTYPFNLTGQPAATVPCGFASNGLPVGLQLVGRWRDDTTVLRAAAAFEAIAPWANARPPLD